MAWPKGKKRTKAEIAKMVAAKKRAGAELGKLTNGTFDVNTTLTGLRMERDRAEQRAKLLNHAIKVLDELQSFTD